MSTACLSGRSRPPQGTKPALPKARTDRVFRTSGSATTRVAQNERDSLMLIGSYIGILAVTNMLLAASASELRRAQAAVSESERRLR